MDPTPPLVTRIAPSPTGMYHLGTARTAYFCWLAARASGGTFILRIDDTDAERNSAEAVQVILDSMAWLGLDYDRIEYQSQRLGFYKAVVGWMVEHGGARQLDDGSTVLNVPVDMPDGFYDSIAGHILITNNARNQMHDLVLMRADGSPTYHLASVVDDAIMGVNWIIRGHDHISNTPKQIAIWRAMHFGAFDGDYICGGDLKCPCGEDKPRSFPKVSHVGLIHGADGKKLSKRDAAASLLSYRDQGYHPEAILSFLIRLGWAPRVDDKNMKIITRQQALELFLTGGAMRSAPANFDQRRLDNVQANIERQLRIPPDQWVHKRARTATGNAAAT